MSTGERITKVIEQIRADGGRITPQRLAIIHVLFEDPSHPTIDQVHQAVLRNYPATSIATVYKTVALLKKLGHVAELGVPSHASHYDGLDKPPHAHLTCIRCGRVWDLGFETAAGEQVQARAANAGFELVPGAIEYRGLCSTCRAELTKSDHRQEPNEHREV